MSAINKYVNMTNYVRRSNEFFYGLVVSYAASNYTSRLSRVCVQPTKLLQRNFSAGAVSVRKHSLLGTGIHNKPIAEAPLLHLQSTAGAVSGDIAGGQGSGPSQPLVQ